MSAGVWGLVADVAWGLVALAVVVAIGAVLVGIVTYLRNER